MTACILYRKQIILGQRSVSNKGKIRCELSLSLVTVIVLIFGSMMAIHVWMTTTGLAP